MSVTRRSPTTGGRGRHAAAGFTLLEMLIALVVTLLVTGAVFGLLTAGQSAFRREPYLTDRQQSIRQAMNIIQEDIARAGVGLPPFVQAFTDLLDDAGGPGVLVAGQDTDHLEILAGDPRCPVLDVCVAPLPAAQSNFAGAAGSISVETAPTGCVQANLPGYFAFFRAQPGGAVAIHPVSNVVVPPVPGCPGGDHLNLGARMAWTPGVGTFAAAGYSVVQIVRYEVTACPDGVPCLYRSITGRFDGAGAAVGAAPGPPGNLTWQIVARGVDDLQVQYRSGTTAPAAWDDVPGAVSAAACTDLVSCNTIVRQLQVTLSAQAVTPPNARLQGETSTGAGVPSRVRGQLTGVFTPRTALSILNTPGGTQPPIWQ